MAPAPREQAAPAPLRQAGPDLAVTVLQQRFDDSTRTVGVEATNRTDTPVHFSAVQPSGVGLDGPTTSHDTHLQPGRTVALRTSYGRPNCLYRRNSVTAHLQVEGRTVDYPIDAARQDEVRRLLDVDCAGITLSETARVRLSGPYRLFVNGDPRLRGRLVAQRLSPRRLGGRPLAWR